MNKIKKNKQLKKCPFCGGKAELRKLDYEPNNGGNTPTYVIGCKKCSASTIYRYNEKDAIDAWNK